MDARLLDGVQEEAARLVDELQRLFRSLAELSLVGESREGQLTDVLLAEAQLRHATEQMVHDVKELQEIEGVLDMETLLAEQ